MPRAKIATLARRTLFITHLTSIQLDGRGRRRPPIDQTTRPQCIRSAADIGRICVVSPRQQSSMNWSRGTLSRGSTTKKAPDRSPGLFEFVVGFRLEAIVDAGAHEVGVELRVGSKDRAATAEIGVEIFDLRGPRSAPVSYTHLRAHET